MAKSKYGTARLDWAKAQLSKWERYLEDNAYHEVDDRTTDSKNGIMVIATVEQIHKDQRDTLKEYLLLLAEVLRLEKEEGVKENDTYGGAKVSPRMSAYEDSKDSD